MNRFEKFLGLKGEAKLKYLDGDIQVILPGDFVVCAVTGQKILVDDLRYWSVELQEPYVSAKASFKRYRELQGRVVRVSQLLKGVARSFETAFGLLRMTGSFLQTTTSSWLEEPSPDQVPARLRRRLEASGVESKRCTAA